MPTRLPSSPKPTIARGSKNGFPMTRKDALHNPQEALYLSVLLSFGLVLVAVDSHFVENAVEICDARKLDGHNSLGLSE